MLSSQTLTPEFYSALGELAKDPTYSGRRALLLVGKLARRTPNEQTARILDQIIDHLERTRLMEPYRPGPSVKEALNALRTVRAEMPQPAGPLCRTILKSAQ